MNTPSPIALSVPRAWFTPEDVGRMVGLATYTIREHARLGRLSARKRPCGRGRSAAWEIHIDEIARYLDHGLLPSPYSKKS